MHSEYCSWSYSRPCHFTVSCGVTACRPGNAVHKVWAWASGKCSSESSGVTVTLPLTIRVGVLAVTDGMEEYHHSREGERGVKSGTDLVASGKGTTVY